MAGKPGRSGGARPGAGRPKKAPAVVVVPPVQDPLAFLASVMNDPKADAVLRLNAAKALLPFVHRRVAAGKKVDHAADAAAIATRGRFASAGTPPPLELIPTGPDKTPRG